MATGELKNETTLAAIAENPEANPHYLLFAIIVDASEPTKFGEDSNYVTRLKIIDPSFNHKADIKGTELKFFKFAHVNIYTETPEQAPKIKYIGDIIRLRRFRWAISEAKGELQGFEKVKYSNWIIYSGEKDAKNNFHSSSYKNYAKNVNRECTDYEKNRITDLREWAVEYFSKNSLRYIIWWNDCGDPFKRDEKVNQRKFEDVDLIVKVTDVNLKDNRMKFVDIDDNEYQIALEYKPSQTKDQIIKLRCVEVTIESKKDDLRTIKLTSHSSCLYLRPYFRDAVTFTLDRKKFNKKNYYILEYPEKKGGLVTAIKKVNDKIKPTTIAKLNQYLREPDVHVNDKFVVEGRIVEFQSTDYNQIIKKQISRNLPVVPLKENTEKTKYQIIYHIVVGLGDDNSKEKLDFHLITSEENYYMFDAWNILPQTKDNAAWNAIKAADLKKFSHKLDTIAEKKMKAKFVLQLLKTETGKPFYKVVDTMFVDF